MRPVRSATWTSGDPVSVSWRRCSAIVAVVSGMRGERFLSVAEEIRVTRRPSAGRSSSARAEDPAGRGDVLAHLLDQLLDAFEALLPPEPLDEPHRGGLVVEVALEVEEERLEEGRVGVGVEGRPAAQRDRG